MTETISTPQEAEESQEKKEKIYPSVSEYLSAFEESNQFEEALSEREKELSFERPDKHLNEKELIESLRMVPAYRMALIEFYRQGNKLPDSLEMYNEDTQRDIGEYWKCLKSIPNHIQVVRATARDKEDEEIKIFRMEKNRDRLHTFAGLSLLGQGVVLENGDQITCDEIDSKNESALDLASYSTLGRQLVSIITEENGLDIVDPQREEKKTQASLDFLNNCRYSGGHWVGKGER